MLARHLVRNAIGYVALLAVLAGTSLAAGTKLLPRNSVGSAQVVNGSLLRIDVKRGQTVGLRGGPGTKGPTGPRGATGARGPLVPRGSFSAAEVTAPQGPTMTFAATTITLPVAGNLYLIGRLDSLGFSCSAACAYTIGLYVDGHPVDRGGLQIPARCIPPVFCLGGNPDRYKVSALATNLPAGTHQITFAGGPTSGSPGPATPGAAEVGAFTLG